MTRQRISIGDAICAPLPILADLAGRTTQLIVSSQRTKGKGAKEDGADAVEGKTIGSVDCLFRLHNRRTVNGCRHGIWSTY